VVGDALACARDHLAGEGIGRAPAHNVKLALRVEQIDGTKCYMTVFLSSETYGNDATVLVFNRWMRSRKHSGRQATTCHTQADLRAANAPIAIALPRVPVKADVVTHTSLKRPSHALASNVEDEPRATSALEVLRLKRSVERP